MYPPMPDVPATNYHTFLFGVPLQSDMPDHVMHIDGLTGQKRTRSEFLERMYDGATALGSRKITGGLGFSSNDMIGILSDNCLVGVAQDHTTALPAKSTNTGLHGPGAFLAHNHDAFRPVLYLCHATRDDAQPQKLKGDTHVRACFNTSSIPASRSQLWVPRRPYLYPRRRIHGRAKVAKFWTADPQRAVQQYFSRTSAGS